MVLSRNRKLLAVGALALAMALPASGEGPGERLEELLTRLDHTAATYASAALKFSCTETMRWQGREVQEGHRRFHYVVTLDDRGSFKDYRTLARNRRQPDVPKRVEPRDYGVPRYLRSAFFWPFVFKRDRWPSHRYEIVGEHEVFGRPAIGVRFEPIPPYRDGVNEWFGTAWVDQETAQILEVTAHRPEDEEQLRAIERHAEGAAVSDWTYVVEEITTEFTIEERGLRFPRRVELRQNSYSFLRGIEDWRRSERTLLSVDQIYTAYRFFEVETTTRVDPEER